VTRQFFRTSFPFSLLSFSLLSFSDFAQFLFLFLDHLFLRFFSLSPPPVSILTVPKNYASATAEWIGSRERGKWRGNGEIGQTGARRRGREWRRRWTSEKVKIKRTEEEERGKKRRRNVH
jgi:hypothetical protein